MSTHRREDVADTSTPTYALAEFYRIIAGIGLVGWVAIVYVASELFDCSGAQIVGFAIGIAFIALIVGVALRVSAFALCRNES